MVSDSHKAIQVLHHAFVFDLEHILLLDGNNSGCVTHGVFVSVSQSARECHSNVPEDINANNSLDWIHDKTRPDENDLNKVLDCLTINEALLDTHSFEMRLALARHQEQCGISSAKALTHHSISIRALEHDQGRLGCHNQFDMALLMKSHS